jgi:hypothetical protein
VTQQLEDEISQCTITSNHPLEPFVMDHRGQSPGLGRNTIKDVTIALNPNHPTDQNLECVKSLANRLVEPLASNDPPVCQGTFRMRHKVVKLSQPQDAEPDFLAEGAAQWEVCDSFISVQAQMAQAIILQPMSLPASNDPEARPKERICNMVGLPPC